MFWWLLFVIATIIFYVKVWKVTQHWEGRNIEIVRPVWPIFGNMPKIFFRKTSFGEGLQEMYNKSNARYFGMYNFLKPSIVIKDTDLWKQIAIKDFDSFLDHAGFIDPELDTLFGKGLFSLRGEKWRQMRSTMSPTFTSSKMRAMFILMQEVAEQFSKVLLTDCKLNGGYKALELKDMFTKFANDVVASCAFGIKCDSVAEPNNEFYVIGKKTTHFRGVRALKLFLLNISPMISRLFKIQIFEEELSNFFRNLVKTTIETRKEKGIIRPDMLQLLVEAKEGKLKHEESSAKTEKDTVFSSLEETSHVKQSNKQMDLTDDDITAQLLGFFFAGFDTIATMMCHMAYELAQHPDIQDKLREEIEESIEKANGKITYELVIKMKYLDMVVSETMRKWPAIMTDRLCTKDYVIQPVNPNEKPFVMYKGENFLLPIFCIHRDPHYYPDPDRFDPERFSDDNKGNIDPAAYIPFGAGPRNCIGFRFALLEAKIMFVYLLTKFDIVVDKKSEIPLKLSHSDFNLVSDNGFWVGLKARNVD